jgi:hypothetical protein
MQKNAKPSANKPLFFLSICESFLSAFLIAKFGVFVFNNRFQQLRGDPTHLSSATNILVLIPP